jgi:two-component system chemotaxis sensor kinase CheA
VIEVSDDGAGINREKVRKIAESKNLISPDAQLSQTEIDNLLFLPGFSSKDEISALSGRGVGLDVVRREITSLGGRVIIQSTNGIGTSFTISLPLTLAVLQGMLVEVEGQTVVIPINAIVETIQPHTVKIHSTGTHTRVVQNRGDLVPLVDAGHSLNLRAPLQNITDRILIIVETDKFNRAALLVDRIHDTRQVVIKSLEENYGEIPGISAATILGNGRIALILDPDEIVHAAGAGPLPIALEA